MLLPYLLDHPSQANPTEADGTRTPDLISAIDALSQLSYAPTRGKICRGAVKDYSRRIPACQTWGLGCHHGQIGGCFA